MAEEVKNTGKKDEKNVGYQTSKKQKETVQQLRKDPTQPEGANQE